MKMSAKVFVLKNSTSSMKAFGTLIIDELIEVSGFKVFEGAKGTFVAVPSTAGKPGEDGKPVYYDNIKFTDMDETGKSAAKEEICNLILEAYKNQISSNTRNTTASSRTNDPAPTGKRPAMAKAASW